jgi:hypothetical protein
MRFVTALMVGIVLACADLASAARCRGTFSDAFSGQERAFRLRRARVAAPDTLAGVIARCGAQCALRGALDAPCTPATGPSGTRECAGTGGTGGCTVDGFLYAPPGAGTRFEGTYSCPGGQVGAFSFRCRRRL